MIYLLKFTLCLGLLLAFYHLVLEKEKMHRFNRFYLLGSVLFSLAIPFSVIHTVPDLAENVISTSQYNNIITGASEASILSTLKSTVNDYSNLLLGFYILIGSLFLIRFSKNLSEIITKINKNRKVNYKKAKVVLIADDILPHTFLNYIFINKDEFEGHEIEDELLSHELAHVSQKHTIDIILIEFFQVIFWFNPLIIFLKNAIRLNHEFLADEAAIAQHQNIARYQQLLLTKATSNYNSHLASNINYSLTKKRFLMMTTSKSSTTILFKKLLLIPIILGLGFLFANKISAQKGVTDKMIKEYTAIAKKVNATSEYNEKDLKRLKVIYSQMSESQRKDAITFPMKKGDGDVGHGELHEEHEGDEEHEHFEGHNHNDQSKEHQHSHDKDGHKHKKKELKEMKMKKKAKVKKLKKIEKNQMKELKVKKKAQMKELKVKEKAKVKELKKVEKLKKTKIK